MGDLRDREEQAYYGAQQGFDQLARRFGRRVERCARGEAWDGSAFIQDTEALRVAFERWMVVAAGFVRSRDATEGSD